jgi:predicted ATP-grasp superfamily ATP-dependent carboligase
MARIWAIGASVRALAQSLIAQGHEVLAADLFNDLDLQRIAKTQRIEDYPVDLLKLIDDVSADAFVYTGGLENYPDLIDALATKLPLLGNGGNVLRRVRDVRTLQAVLNRNGFAMPEMIWPTDASQPSGRWLRKSPNSSGGQRLHWANVSTRAPGPGEYWQRFVDGAVYGASFRVTDGKVSYLGAARQLTDCPWTNAPPFHYAGSIGPVILPPTVQQEIERLGQCLAAEFQLKGWFGIDLVIDRKGRAWVLEVNPRYTASMELLSSLGLSGKAVLYSRKALRVSAEFVEQLLTITPVADIPTAGTQIPAGSPILTVVTEGKEEGQVLAALESNTKAIDAML